MRAAVITEPGGPDVLKIMEVDDPVPGPDDNRVGGKAPARNRRRGNGTGAFSTSVEKCDKPARRLRGRRQNLELNFRRLFRGEPDIRGQI